MTRALKDSRPRRSFPVKCNSPDGRGNATPTTWAALRSLRLWQEGCEASTVTSITPSKPILSRMRSAWETLGMTERQLARRHAVYWRSLPRFIGTRTLRQREQSRFINPEDLLVNLALYALTRDGVAVARPPATSPAGQNSGARPCSVKGPTASSPRFSSG